MDIREDLAVRFGDGVDRPSSVFEIFPEELWLTVFNEITDPNDMKRCAKASNEFRQMLETERCRYLYSEVIPVIISKVFPVLQKHDLLSMRLVCLSWKLGIDNYVAGGCQAFLKRPVFNSINDRLPPALLNDMIRPYCFQNFAQVNTFFMSEQHGHHSVPFKFIEFRDNIDSRKIFPEKICCLLENLAHPLEHLSISNIFNYDFLPSFTLLVSQTPNLKILRLNKIRINNLSINNANRELPPLPQLETLSISSTDEQIVQILMRNYSTSVKHLELFGSVVSSELPMERYPPNLAYFPARPHLPRREWNMPNMVNLITLSLLENDTGLINSSQIESWPVEKLNLLPTPDASVLPHLERYPGANILETVNYLKSTLMSLDLSSCKPFYLQRANAFQHLPRLEHLKVTVDTNQSLNFLQNMPSLKSLHLHVVRERAHRFDYRDHFINQRESEIVTLRESDDMFRSSIWRLVPNLKCAIVKKEVKTCTSSCSDHHYTMCTWEWTTKKYKRPRFI